MPFGSVKTCPAIPAATSRANSDAPTATWPSLAHTRTNGRATPHRLLSADELVRTPAHAMWQRFAESPTSPGHPGRKGLVDDSRWFSDCDGG